VPFWLRSPRVWIGSDATNQRPSLPDSPESPHRNVVPEINTAIADLREVLGDQTHESLAHEGETITAAEMATYAYDQIDQARTGLGPSRFT
jgi:hypothetical protein